MIKFILSLFLLAAPLCAGESVVVGSKAFTESIILAEMAAALLEEEGLEVDRQTNLGGTKVVFDALKGGDIHLYPEYTGTGYVMILKLSGEKNPQKVYQAVSEGFKEMGLAWSPPLGFNNTYALAVRADDPRFKNIDSISDLAGRAKGIVLAAPHEFMERKDGFAPFQKLYRLNFNPEDIKSLNSGLMYAAIRDGQADLVMSYSTDGRIGAYGLRLLKDDKNFFPPYQAAFVLSNEALAGTPELKKVFEKLRGLVAEKDMIALNDQVDRLKADPRETARKFLAQKGLLGPSVSKGRAPSKSFFQFAWRKKDYLLKIAREHVALSFGALVLALLVSLPVGILLTRRPGLAKVVFPVVNTVQTVPSLALLGFLVPLTGIGYAPAVIALFLYSLLPLIRNTYSGIDGVDKEYKEASRGLGLTDRQILLRVELPLAAPIILAGIRTASVIVIGAATLAALVGAGGLGDPIFRGVATVNENLILLGALPSALMAIAADKALGFAEKKIVSKGLRL